MMTTLVILPPIIYILLVALFYGPLFIIAQYRAVLFFTGMLLFLCTLLVSAVNTVSDRYELTEEQKGIHLSIVLIISPILMLAISKKSLN